MPAAPTFNPDLNLKIIYMEANKILTSNLLDIIFDGRNKEYGAYELRKNSNRRLIKAMSWMATVTLLLFLSSFLLNRRSGTKIQALVVADVQLEEVKQEVKNDRPPHLRRLKQQCKR